MKFYVHFTSIRHVERIGGRRVQQPETMFPPICKGQAFRRHSLRVITNPLSSLSGPIVAAQITWGPGR